MEKEQDLWESMLLLLYHFQDFYIVYSIIARKGL